MSTLITKVYIAASCHGVIRRFVRHRWRVLDPCVSRLVSGFFHWSCHCRTLLPLTRARDLLSLALHAGCNSHALELCRSVILLHAAVFVDLALYLAVCGLASVELSCSLTTLVLRARLAPFPRLPVLGAFHALFLSYSPARDLQHVTWQMRFCLLEVGTHCTCRLGCYLLEVGHR